MFTNSSATQETNWGRVHCETHTRFQGGGVLDSLVVGTKSQLDGVCFMVNTTLYDSAYTCVQKLNPLKRIK